MVSFLDGPAADQILALRRAPLFLRVVRSQSGEFDALDQPDDSSRDRESIYVYQRANEPGHIHLKSGKGDPNGYFAMASYRMAENPPPDHVARQRKQWRQWCQQQADAM